MSLIAQPLYGPLNASQQRAAHKWSVPLNEGYTLYFGAPTCVFSADASRNALLFALPGGQRVIDRLVKQGNALIAAEAAKDRPGRLKVYYKKYAFGDIQPMPQYPEVLDAAGKTRPPNQAEDDFTAFCAKMLPMYDVTLRALERKQLNIFQKAFGAEDAAPLDLKSPLAALRPADVVKTFSSWKAVAQLPARAAPPAMTLAEFFKDIAKYNAGGFDGPGYVEFSFGGNLKLVGAFAKLAVFDIKEAKSAPNVILCRKLMFLGAAGGNATALLQGAHATLTISPDAANDPVVELRLAGGAMKRVPIAVSTRLFFSTQTAKLGVRASNSTHMSAGELIILALFFAPLFIALSPIYILFA